jgi:tripeptide aminopeptidase
MFNALLIAMEFHAMLPSAEAPQHTEGYEGFYHLNNLNGSVEEAAMIYILRDHNRVKFEERKQRIQKIAQYLNEKYGVGTVQVDLQDQYFNMRSKVEPVYHIIELARSAMEEVNVKPIIKPIRGGTDGARLSYMNLPCPNIFTGGHNFHGRYEYIPVRSMQKAVEVIIRIAEKATAL